MWEWLARRIWHTTPVPGAVHGMFDIHLGPYAGKEVMLLPDGTTIYPGDQVAELHLNNRIWVEAAKVSMWRTGPKFRDDLRALARWMSRPDFPPEIHAVYGLTIVASGAPLFGFTVRERPITVQAHLDRFFMTGLLSLYTSEGPNRRNKGSTFGTYPREIWLSRTELMRRYGPVEQ